MRLIMFVYFTFPKLLNCSGNAAQNSDVEGASYISVVTEDQT